MTTEEANSMSADDEMRRMSGAVDDDRPLVALLFVLMRDHVTPGLMEEVFERHVAVAGGRTQQYSNGWLARHAQDLARRLGAGSDAWLRQLLRQGVKFAEASDDEGAEAWLNQVRAEVG